MKAFFALTFWVTFTSAQRGMSKSSGPYGTYPSNWIDFSAGTDALGQGMKAMFGGLKPPPEILKSGGSGKYKAKVFEDPSLQGHTIFAPAQPPADMKLPLFLWANGGCMALGQTHGGILTEIASHGYFVIANGKSNPTEVVFANSTDLFDAALWAGKSGAKYNIDTTNIASAGQSCGGMQAYTANQLPGIKTTLIFNSGLILNGNLRSKLSNLQGSVLYMEGGRSDVGYSSGKSDFQSLTKTPAVFLSADVGHQIPKTWHPHIVEWLNWHLRGEGETTAKSKFLSKGSLAPYTEHFSKNWVLT